MQKWMVWLAGALLWQATAQAQAQTPGAPRAGGAGNGMYQGGNGQRQMPQIGHLYGKLVDAGTGKPVAYASVVLLKMRDSSVAAGMLTAGNGDFNLENLPFGAFNMRITFMGYTTINRKITITPQSIEQDLGNIKLHANTKTLNTVEVTGEKSAFTMGIDRKIFNVDRNLVSVGGTAQDVLKSVPTVNVDIDGNVTVRNASPNIFVDGKPTTLTLDQIPADAIESVELITNPSAKYDAEGMSGILNIVLKKNKRAGINGSIMGGIGTGSKYNGGGSLNVRQGKWNVSANYNVNANRTWGDGTTHRTNFGGGQPEDTSWLLQQSNSTSKPLFQFGRIGVDYYLDNRNTLSLSQNIVAGDFKNSENLLSTFASKLRPDSLSDRLNNSNFNFRNYSTQLGFRHTYAKPNKEWTADFSLSRNTNKRTGNFNTRQADNSGKPVGDPILQDNNGNGKTTFITIQTDYTDPIGKNAKLELGAKTTLRDYTSTYNVYDHDASGNPVFNDLLSNDYQYNEQIYAGYGNFASTIGNFGYQAGLRVEQYIYSGKIPSEDKAYKPTKASPGFFPSVYLSEKLAHDQELQLNYSRRVTRPNFFQLVPYRDYSDPLNQREGNPNLKPEYTNSLEFSYMKTWKSSSFLGSLYYRNTNNLISTISTPLGLDTLLTTYVNANKSNAYGAELTMKNSLFRFWDITTNVNLYQTELKVQNAKDSYNNNGFSWMAKLNSETRLPANFTLQINATYQAPTIALPSQGGGGSGGGGGGGGRGGGGGGGGFMMIPTSAQGTIKGFSSVDIGLKKDFLKKKHLSVTMNLTDVFNTRHYELEQTTPYFTQDYLRKRESRIFKVNISYRFGKFDTQLFKRRNRNDRDNQNNNNMGDPTQVF